jgi:hypothetical protein
MQTITERRREQRLRYRWPVWFAEDFKGVLTQGQMVDVNSTGAAFTCNTAENYIFPGQKITTRFSIPRFCDEESFDMASFVRTGSIKRVEEVNPFTRRIAVEFAEPLPFRPGEQCSREEVAHKMKAVTI